jgi:subtilisin family serine protease
MMRTALMAFTALCVASGAFAQAELAPLQNQGVRGAIPNRYIVVMKPGVSREAIGDIRQRITGIGGKVLHVYTSALNGFSVEISPEGLQALRALPGVDYIEVDQLGSGETLQPPSPAGAPPSGIDRIDRRLTPLNGTYSYSETGAGVNAYIIDSGIRATHSDFGGRASGAIDFVGDGNGTNDCHGHGTNVAGIVGGSQFGVAKNVTIHAVRVLDCMNRGSVSNFIAGLDWVHNNAVQPAIANMSILADNPSTAFDTAVTNLVNAGVPVTLAAGNNNVDACGVSPARTPVAITVGATVPATDARASFSNFGTCLDLFAPGVNILSAGIANDTATSTFSGTSQAAPHVAGVAARFLQTHPAATPAAVLAAIHAADDVASTPGWGGIGSAGAGSPNELLHWGSLNDGQTDGDPHLTTVEAVRYDFQAAGEFVALRDGESLEIQTRQTAVSTAAPLFNDYAALSACVAVNTAVAAKVNKRRVTLQPRLDGEPSPDGLELRIDGQRVRLPEAGIDLGNGGRASASLGGGLRLDFPDGAILLATPGWWSAQQLWYLNIGVLGSRAEAGIMGVRAVGSWLPALPDGTSLGARPTTAPGRYDALYKEFADAWRVADATSLFDYAPGRSTKDYILAGWPPQKPPCVAPNSPVAEAIDPGRAATLCFAAIGQNQREAALANCTADVAVTGEPGFAKTYALSAEARAGLVAVTLGASSQVSAPMDPVTFTAAVAVFGGDQEHGYGAVQFLFDGERTERPVELDKFGRAMLKTSRLSPGEHRIVALYEPSGSALKPGRSNEIVHSVRGQ